MPRAISSSKEALGFVCPLSAPRAIFALFSTSLMFLPNFSSISLCASSLSCSVIEATRLSFSSLIWVRQPSPSDPSDDTYFCIIGVGCTTGGSVTRKACAPGCCWASLLRAKTLFDRCCATGNPLFDPTDLDGEGGDAEERGSRSNIEPRRGLDIDALDKRSRSRVRGRIELLKSKASLQLLLSTVMSKVINVSNELGKLLLDGWVCELHEQLSP